jgi:hypothetical protein
MKKEFKKLVENRVMMWSPPPVHESASSPGIEKTF